MSAALIIFLVVILSALGYLLFLFFTGKLLPQLQQQPQLQQPPQAQQPQAQQSSQAQAPKNMCNRGPQSKLNNRTCKEIADLPFNDGTSGAAGFMAMFGNQYKKDKINNMTENDRFNTIIDPSILGPFDSNNAPSPTFNFKFW